VSVDLRGFDYALEPLRHQRQWQLDGLLARLGKIQSAIHRAQDELEILAERHRIQSREVEIALAERLDPLRHSRSLRWLANLKKQVHEGEEHLSTLQAQRSEIAAQCLVQQQKVDVVEAHKEECVAEFIQHEAGRMITEADRDWLARASYHKRARTMNSKGNPDSSRLSGLGVRQK